MPCNMAAFPRYMPERAGRHVLALAFYSRCRAIVRTVAGWSGLEGYRMRTEMIDYQTRRVGSPLTVADVPAADDRTVTMIREALRDRQAEQLACEVRT